MSPLQDIANGRPRRWPGQLFWAQWLLMIALGAVFGWEMVARLQGSDQAVLAYGLSSDTLREGRWWTLVTHMFLHAGLAHIAMNASFALAVGAPVAMMTGADLAGGLRYLLLFLVCGILGGATFLALNPGSHTVMLGASGALSGLWGAASRFPVERGRLQPIWAPRVWRASAPFLLINVVLMGLLSGLGLPIAWQAHLGGFLAGLLLVGVFASRESLGRLPREFA